MKNKNENMQNKANSRACSDKKGRNEKLSADGEVYQKNNSEKFLAYMHRFGQNGIIKSVSKLSKSENIVIIALGVQGGSAKISTVVNEMCVSKPSASRTFKSLELKGYITRETDFRDRRSTMLKLTDKGTELFNDIDVAIKEMLHKTFERFSDDKANQLMELLEEFSEISEEVIREFNQSKKNKNTKED